MVDMIWMDDKIGDRSINVRQIDRFEIDRYMDRYISTDIDEMRGLRQIAR